MRVRPQVQPLKIYESDCLGLFTWKLMEVNGELITVQDYIIQWLIDDEEV